MISDLQVRRSVRPHDCPDACGTLAHIRDGRVTRVPGDPDHFGARGLPAERPTRAGMRIPSSGRAPYPQKRVGSKGDDAFERTTWGDALGRAFAARSIEQALDILASRERVGVMPGRLNEGGPVCPNVEAPHPAFADGHFPTPSGKIVLYAESMVASGLDPLPAHTPLSEGGDGERLPEGSLPLVFITHPNSLFRSSTYTNMPSTMRSEERPRLESHPSAAAAYGSSGDAVRVHNRRGDMQREASLTERVRAGAVVGRGLWWGKHSPGGRGVSAITPQLLAGMGGGATIVSNLVEMRRRAGGDSR